ncbi:DMSO/TMAO reductase YedYZ molybdopterin-dependent catalytic subunit [Tamaricihabitans halophyticus]|uniref:DMSO/TMAO reductase YedYZ molybdopterin-dependent catalytic subunit n=1 Tax=Tamaricihabitans halophyticus TaxID=1262583 RepID=A0A4R2QN66_9PSEU|nr:DUF2867 domain-containing protein [Tamaricihabitans halophyticus]TCP48511.1 DMSO/TMAO reductase YedYZ molybdopterin-dependent catalytic subunit [Tamaricihabitans halophyticus]
MKTLPPGQRRIDGFPRFGTHLHRPPPAVPVDPEIALSGAVPGRTVRLAELSQLPRREIVADFHCVAGWTATDLRWEGVRFADFYRAFIEPTLERDTAVTHLAFEGLDGVVSVVELRDALADDVLLADKLNGQPLTGDHGAPVRLVCPTQYGYVNIKHLCLIEVCSTLPVHRLGSGIVDRLIEGHPRGRVWHEERHARIDGRMVRPFYRALIGPIRWLSARGSTSRRRVPNDALKAQRWIIDDIAHDFDIEDVWALPIEGGPADFEDVIDLIQFIDFPDSAPMPVRLLWGIRDLLGRVFGIGRVSTSADQAGVWPPVPETDEPSLTDRLPAELRSATTDSRLGDKPFRPLYRTDTEFAEEISNRTVYGVMHLAWVDRGDDRYQAHMTVYVKPRGTLGKAYLALIKPFRYAIVYPALMRYLGRLWTERRAAR